MLYEVVKAHKSNYPNPIVLSQGQFVRVGARYDGPECWDNWVYCCTLDGLKGGWVPEQILRVENGTGVVLSDYTAKELDVVEGETVTVLDECNGWAWCRKASDGEEGWVPKENLRPSAD